MCSGIPLIVLTVLVVVVSSFGGELVGVLNQLVIVQFVSL